jgi:hypothetical protein
MLVRVATRCLGGPGYYTWERLLDFAGEFTRCVAAWSHFPRLVVTVALQVDAGSLKVGFQLLGGLVDDAGHAEAFGGFDVSRDVVDVDSFAGF